MNAYLVKFIPQSSTLERTQEVEAANSEEAIDSIIEQWGDAVEIVGAWLAREEGA